MISPIGGKTNVKQAENMAANQEKSGLISLAEKIAKFYRWIFFILAIVGTLAVALILFSAYQSSLDPLKAEINNKTVELKARMADLEKLKSMKVNYADLSASGQSVIEALPIKEDIASLIASLKAPAMKNNLSFSAHEIADQGKLDSAEENQAAEKYSKATLIVDLSGGDYFALKNYLSDVEQNLQLLDIESINYTGAKSYELTVNAYYQISTNVIR